MSNKFKRNLNNSSSVDAALAKNANAVASHTSNSDLAGARDSKSKNSNKKIAQSGGMNRPVSQQGYLFLLLTIVMFFGLTLWGVSSLLSESVEKKQRSQQATFEVLNKARDALIDHVLFPPPSSRANDVVGSWYVRDEVVNSIRHSVPFSPLLFPCPDLISDDNLDGLSDYGCAEDLQATSGPSAITDSGGLALVAGSRIGRLPWRASTEVDGFVHGLGAEFRDANDNRLWYAVSPNVVDEKSVINPHSLLRLTTGWLSVEDAQGALISDRVVAVIIAPNGSAKLYPEDEIYSSTLTVDFTAAGFGAADVAAYLDEENRDNDLVFVSSRAVSGVDRSQSSERDELVFITIDDLIGPGSRGLEALNRLQVEEDRLNLLAGTGGNLGVQEILDAYLKRFGHLPDPSIFGKLAIERQDRAAGLAVEEDLSPSSPEYKQVAVVSRSGAATFNAFIPLNELPPVYLVKDAMVLRLDDLNQNSGLGYIEPPFVNGLYNFDTALNNENVLASVTAWWDGRVTDDDIVAGGPGLGTLSKHYPPVLYGIAGAGAGAAGAAFSADASSSGSAFEVELPRPIFGSVHLGIAHTVQLASEAVAYFDNGQDLSAYIELNGNRDLVKDTPLYGVGVRLPAGTHVQVSLDVASDVLLSVRIPAGTRFSYQGPLLRATVTSAPNAPVRFEFSQTGVGSEIPRLSVAVQEGVLEDAAVVAGNIGFLSFDSIEDSEGYWEDSVELMTLQGAEMVINSKQAYAVAPYGITIRPVTNVDLYPQPPVGGAANFNAGNLVNRIPSAMPLGKRKDSYVWLPPTSRLFFNVNSNSTTITMGSLIDQLDVAVWAAPGAIVGAPGYAANDIGAGGEIISSGNANTLVTLHNGGFLQGAIKFSRVFGANTLAAAASALEIYAGEEDGIEISPAGGGTKIALGVTDVVQPFPAVAIKSNPIRLTNGNVINFSSRSYGKFISRSRVVVVPEVRADYAVADYKLSEVMLTLTVDIYGEEGGVTSKIAATADQTIRHTDSGTRYMVLEETINNKLGTTPTPVIVAAGGDVTLSDWAVTAEPVVQTIAEIDEMHILNALPRVAAYYQDLLPLDAVGTPAVLLTHYNTEIAVDFSQYSLLDASGSENSGTQALTLVIDEGMNFILPAGSALTVGDVVTDTYGGAVNTYVEEVTLPEGAILYSGEDFVDAGDLGGNYVVLAAPLQLTLATTADFEFNEVDSSDPPNFMLTTESRGMIASRLLIKSEGDVQIKGGGDKLLPGGAWIDYTGARAYPPVGQTPFTRYLAEDSHYAFSDRIYGLLRSEVTLRPPRDVCLDCLVPQSYNEVKDGDAITASFVSYTRPISAADIYIYNEDVPSYYPELLINETMPDPMDPTKTIPIVGNNMNYGYHAGSDIVSDMEYQLCDNRSTQITVEDSLGIPTIYDTPGFITLFIGTLAAKGETTIPTGRLSVDTGGVTVTSTATIPAAPQRDQYISVYLQGSKNLGKYHYSTITISPYGDGGYSRKFQDTGVETAPGSGENISTIVDSNVFEVGVIGPPQMRAHPVAGISQPPHIARTDADAKTPEGGLNHEVFFTLAQTLSVHMLNFELSRDPDKTFTLYIENPFYDPLAVNERVMISVEMLATAAAGNPQELLNLKYALDTQPFDSPLHNYDALLDRLSALTVLVTIPDGDMVTTQPVNMTFMTSLAIVAHFTLQLPVMAYRSPFAQEDLEKAPVGGSTPDAEAFYTGLATPFEVEADFWPISPTPIVHDFSKDGGLLLNLAMVMGGRGLAGSKLETYLSHDSMAMSLTRYVPPTVPHFTDPSITSDAFTLARSDTSGLAGQFVDFIGGNTFPVGLDYEFACPYPNLAGIPGAVQVPEVARFFESTNYAITSETATSDRASVLDVSKDTTALNFWRHSIDGGNRVYSYESGADLVQKTIEPRVASQDDILAAIGYMTYVAVDSAGVIGSDIITLDDASKDGLVLPAGALVMRAQARTLSFQNPNLWGGDAALHYEGGSSNLTDMQIFIPAGSSFSVESDTSAAVNYNGPGYLVLDGNVFLSGGGGKRGATVLGAVASHYAENIQWFGSGEIYARPDMVSAPGSVPEGLLESFAGRNKNVHAKLSSGPFLLDDKGRTSHEMARGFMADLLPENTAQLLKSNPLIYAVAPQCRRHLSGSLGEYCAQGENEGLRVSVESGTKISLHEDLLAPGEAFILPRLTEGGPLVAIQGPDSYTISRLYIEGINGITKGKGRIRYQEVGGGAFENFAEEVYVTLVPDEEIGARLYLGDTLSDVYTMTGNDLQETLDDLSYVDIYKPLTLFPGGFVSADGRSYEDSFTSIAGGAQVIDVDGTGTDLKIEERTSDKQYLWRYDLGDFAYDSADPPDSRISFSGYPDLALNRIAHQTFRNELYNPVYISQDVFSVPFTPGIYFDNDAEFTVTLQLSGLLAEDGRALDASAFPLEVKNIPLFLHDGQYSSGHSFYANPACLIALNANTQSGGAGDNYFPQFWNLGLEGLSGAGVSYNQIIGGISAPVVHPSLTPAGLVLIGFESPVVFPNSEDIVTGVSSYRYEKGGSSFFGVAGLPCHRAVGHDINKRVAVKNITIPETDSGNIVNGDYELNITFRSSDIISPQMLPRINATVAYAANYSIDNNKRTDDIHNIFLAANRVAPSSQYATDDSERTFLGSSSGVGGKMLELVYDYGGGEVQTISDVPEYSAFLYADEDGNAAFASDYASRIAVKVNAFGESIPYGVANAVAEARKDDDIYFGAGTSFNDLDISLSSAKLGDGSFYVDPNGNTVDLSGTYMLSPHSSVPPVNIVAPQSGGVVGDDGRIEVEYDAGELLEFTEANTVRVGGSYLTLSLGQRLSLAQGFVAGGYIPAGAKTLIFTQGNEHFNAPAISITGGSNSGGDSIPALMLRTPFKYGAAHYLEENPALYWPNGRPAIFNRVQTTVTLLNQWGGGTDSPERFDPDSGYWGRMGISANALRNYFPPNKQVVQEPFITADGGIFYRAPAHNNPGRFNQSPWSTQRQRESSAYGDGGISIALRGDYYNDDGRSNYIMTVAYEIFNDSSDGVYTQTTLMQTVAFRFGGLSLWIPATRYGLGLGQYARNRAQNILLHNLRTFIIPPVFDSHFTSANPRLDTYVNLADAGEPERYSFGALAFASSMEFRYEEPFPLQNRVFAGSGYKSGAWRPDAAVGKVISMPQFSFDPSGIPGATGLDLGLENSPSEVIYSSIRNLTLTVSAPKYIKNMFETGGTPVAIPSGVGAGEFDPDTGRRHSVGVARDIREEFDGNESAGYRNAPPLGSSDNPANENIYLNLAPSYTHLTAVQVFNSIDESYVVDDSYQGHRLLSLSVEQVGANSAARYLTYVDTTPSASGLAARRNVVHTVAVAEPDPAVRNAAGVMTVLPWSADPAVTRITTQFYADMVYYMDRFYDLRRLGGNMDIAVGPEYLDDMPNVPTFKLEGYAALVPPFAAVGLEATKLLYAQRSELMCDLFGCDSTDPNSKLRPLTEVYSDVVGGACAGNPTGCPALFSTPEYVPIIAGIINLEATDVYISAEAQVLENIYFILAQPTMTVTLADGDITVLYAGSIIYPYSGRAFAATPIEDGRDLASPQDGFSKAVLKIGSKAVVGMDTGISRAPIAEQMLVDGNEMHTFDDKGETYTTQNVRTRVAYSHAPRLFEDDLRVIPRNLRSANNVYLNETQYVVNAYPVVDTDGDLNTPGLNMLDLPRTSFTPGEAVDKAMHITNLTVLDAWNSLGSVNASETDNTFLLSRGGPSDIDVHTDHRVAAFSAYGLGKWHGGFAGGPWIGNDAAVQSLHYHARGDIKAGFPAPRRNALSGFRSNTSFQANTFYGVINRLIPNSNRHNPWDGGIRGNGDTVYHQADVVAPGSIAHRQYAGLHQLYDPYSWDNFQVTVDATGFWNHTKQILTGAPASDYVEHMARAVTWARLGFDSTEDFNFLNYTNPRAGEGWTYLQRIYTNYNPFAIGHWRYFFDAEYIGGTPAGARATDTVLSGLHLARRYTSAGELFIDGDYVVLDDTTKFKPLRFPFNIELNPSTLEIRTFDGNPAPLYIDNAFFKFPVNTRATVMNLDGNSWESVHPALGLHYSGALHSGDRSTAYDYSFPAFREGDGYDTVELSEQSVIHQWNTPSLRRQPHFHQLPVYTNVWIRAEGDSIVTTPDGRQMTIPEGSLINPLLGTYLNGDLIGGSRVFDRRLNVDFYSFPYLTKVTARENVYFVRPAFVLPKGLELMVRGSEIKMQVENVQAIVLHSSHPLQATECSARDAEAFYAGGVGETINQVYGTTLAAAADSGEQFNAGYPCAWLDDHENTNGDLNFVYRNYTYQNDRIDIMKNDRTYLVGGKFVVEWN